MEKWRKRATVGPLTWRDEQAKWLQPISLDPSSIAVLDTLRRAAVAAVLYALHASGARLMGSADHVVTPYT